MSALSDSRTESEDSKKQSDAVSASSTDLSKQIICESFPFDNFEVSLGLIITNKNCDITNFSNYFFRKSKILVREVLGKLEHIFTNPLKRREQLKSCYRARIKSSNEKSILYLCSDMRILFSFMELSANSTLMESFWNT